jgi:hypothetical protein
MTMDVYAQPEQRADRSHGTQFDALFKGAKSRLDGTERPRKGHERPNRR